MSTDPLVSVVIPSYNHRRFIFQAIDSVLKQTYPNIEIVIIDDGSSDGSAELIRRIADNYCRRRPFIVRYRPNKGAHATINEGISLASGSYIAILNSDDYYSKDRIALMVGSALETGAEFVFSEIELIDEFGRPFSSDWYVEALEGAGRHPTSSFCLLKRNLAMSTGNFFFSRRLYSKVGSFTELVTCHDWDFLLRSLFWTEPLFLRQKAYFYRLYETNTINRTSVDLKTTELLYTQSKYLSLVCGTQPPNRLAPCFANWGHYWTEFLAKDLPDLVTRPEVQSLLF